MTNKDNNGAPSAAVAVTIFGQPFNLRAHAGAEHIERIAALVNERMQQVALQLTTHDVAKVAILVALNLADELSSLKEQAAAAERSAQTPAPEPAADGANRQTLDQAQGATTTRDSWFETILDAPTPPRAASERLSNQVSARLQSLRQPDRGESAREVNRPEPD
ncbi:MAG: cell division protein ZapA [Pyrinomonadaceae bacterium]